MISACAKPRVKLRYFSIYDWLVLVLFVVCEFDSSALSTGIKIGQPLSESLKITSHIRYQLDLLSIPSDLIPSKFAVTFRLEEPKIIDKSHTI